MNLLLELFEAVVQYSGTAFTLKITAHVPPESA